MAIKSSNFDLDTLVIRRAETDADLAKIYEFRYRIYVEEMRRKQKCADHQNRRIVDPLDGSGNNFLAERNGQTIGVVRTNYCKDGSIFEYRDLYGTDLYESCAEKNAIITRLMVDQENRDGRLGMLLAAKCFSTGFEAGITRGFIDCNPPLLGFFQAMGFRKYMDTITHYDYGEVQPMVIHLDEASPLRSFVETGVWS